SYSCIMRTSYCIATCTENIQKIQTSKRCEHGSHRDDKTKITDAINDKRLLRCVGILFLFVPKSDKKIAAKSNTFPTQKRPKIIIRHDKLQHHDDEEIEIRKESRETAIALHVPDRIEMDQ